MVLLVMDEANRRHDEALRKTCAERIHHHLNELFAGGGRRRGTIHCRIEYFSEEALKARRRD